jgi:hypothetical protein
VNCEVLSDDLVTMSEIDVRSGVSRLTESDEEMEMERLETETNNVEAAEVCGTGSRRPTSRILDGKYFEIASQNNGRVTAVCKLCTPREVTIKGSETSSSNFLSHLQKKHGEATVQEYRLYLKSKQMQHATKLRKTSRRSREVGPQAVADIITKFVIDTMVPLRIVENQYFKELVPEHSLSACSRRKLRRVILDKFDSYNGKVRDLLEGVANVCTTCDVWSGKRKSFLGLTVHWITANTFERKSAALACRRFKDTHSAERLAELLTIIYNEYNIENKIVASTTDNGSNFVKAFRLWGVQSRNVTANEMTSEVQEAAEVDTECYSASDAETDEESNVGTQERIVIALRKVLPFHIRCASHTLSLCVTTDAQKAMSDSVELWRMHTTVLKKCNRLWKRAGRPKTAEIIEQMLGYTLSRPGATRWNSLYDSLRAVLRIREKSVQLFAALDMSTPLTADDFLYIDEHLQCTKPIAEALDILQGEQNMYYGIFLPTILACERKLRLLTEKTWVYCNSWVQALHSSLWTRFSKYFEFDSASAHNAAIAAFSYPRFKKQWLPAVDPIHQESLLNVFKQRVSRCHGSVQEPESTASNTVAEEDAYFEFGETSTSSTGSSYPSNSNLAWEIFQYFNDAEKDLHMLDRYPTIKQVFLEYNTPLPSSAPVERLFSYAGMHNLPKSNRQADKLFKARVLMKANLTFYESMTL